MVKSTAAAKGKGKKSTTPNICVTEMPHAWVRYLDADNFAGPVPLCNVPEIKGTDFEKGAVYDVFWADKPKVGRAETLPEARKRLQEIPKFPAGSSNEGPGLYPATLLLVGDNLKDLLMKKEQARIRSPSDQCLEAMTKASSSSGFSSTTGSCRSKSSNKQDNDKKEAHSRRAKDNAKNCFLNKGKEIDGDFDDDDEEEDPTLISASDMKQQISALKDERDRYRKNAASFKEKLEDARTELKLLQNSYDTLMTKHEKVVDLNLKYQEHMVSCTGTGTGTGTSDTIEPTLALSLRKPDYNEVASTSTSVDSSKTKRSADESSPVIPAKRIKLAETAEDRSSAAAEDLDKVETEVAVPVVEEDLAEDNTKGQSSNEHQEIHKGVFIHPEAYTASFKKFLDEKAPSVPAGQAHDRDFVISLGEAVFTANELGTSTVKGQMCNARKAATAEPALCEKRLDAVERALYRRVLLEKAKAATLVPPVEIDLKSRVTIYSVRKWIGQLIHNTKKRMKRAADAIEKKAAEEAKKAEETAPQ